jgi:hypothetical protein
VQQPPASDSQFVRPDAIPGLQNSWANVLAFSDWSRVHHAPQFADFPATSPVPKRIAPVDLSSAAGARRFRTVLRDGTRAGPNFAGRYTIVSWGCGSPCVEFVVVDVATGRILYWTDEPWVRPPLFTATSRLIADDPVGFQGVGSPESWSWVRYFEWDGRQLKAVDSLSAAGARVPE